MQNDCMQKEAADAVRSPDVRWVGTALHCRIIRNTRYTHIIYVHPIYDILIYTMMIAQP